VKVVGVISVKGGTGKTLCSINLAHFLRKKTGKNVGLIDGDIDSLPHYTPVIVKINDEVEVTTIADVFDRVSGRTFIRGNKIFKKPDNLMIFRGPTKKSHKTWLKVEWMVKHPYNGKILRINTVAGLVDVSPNHPMLDGNGNVIPASKLLDNMNLSKGYRVSRSVPVPDIAYRHVNGNHNFFIGGKDLAKLYGLLCSDGSVYTSRYVDSRGRERLRDVVAFSNTDYDLVTEVKELMESLFSCKVHGPIEYSRNGKRTLYRVCIENKRLSNYLRSKLYTSDGYKKVPTDILNAPDSIKREFIKGIHLGDGIHDGRTYSYDSIASDSQVLITGLSKIIRESLGKSFTIHIRDDKPNVYQLTINKGNTWKKPRGQIKKIRELEYSGYLYDIETEDDHTFSCGIGPIRVHNSSNFAEFVRTDQKIEVDEETKRFKLFNWDGIKVWSMSLVTEKWRPITMTADKYVQILTDAVNYSDWGNVDYMVVDLPSGAMDSFRGAVFLFAENLVGNVVVVQPAFEDNIRRVLNLHKVNEIPVIGVIENMAYFVCPYHKKPKIFNIFGSNNVEEIVKEYGYTYLGKLPLIPDLQERVRKNGHPILDDYSEPFEKAVDIIESIPQEKVGILTKFKRKLGEIKKNMVDKVIAYALRTLYTEIELPDLRYDENMVLDLVILNDPRTKVISRWHLIMKDKKIRVVKNPKRVDFEVHTTFRTLARIFLRKKRTKEGMIVPYDAYDAWLNLDVEIYGPSSTPRAIRIIKNVLFNEYVSKAVAEKFKFLERYI